MLNTAQFDGMILFDGQPVLAGSSIPLQRCVWLMQDLQLKRTTKSKTPVSQKSLDAHPLWNDLR